MGIWNLFYEASGASHYYEHAICLTNDPFLMALYIGGDLITWMSYMAIGGVLLWRRELTVVLQGSAVWLYGSFIVLCGLSHLTKTMTLFVGAYRVDIVVVVAMAAVSGLTAWLTVRGLVKNKV